MGISDLFKRLWAREDSKAVERSEEKKKQREDLSAGEHFLADEDRVARGVDEQIMKGNRGTLPPDDS